jgi:5-oxoprolinase (ATP-hydrolysing) subunit A
VAAELDLNADLGEGFGVWQLGDDEALLQIVTSANVACGFHAGDPLIMRRVCELAAARGVAIGAQVSFRDLAGFGRRRMHVAPEELAADVLYQLGALDAFAHAAGTRDAAAVAAAVADYDPSLPLLGLPGSAMESAARAAGVPFVAEAFADRGYLPTGRLVARNDAAALITEPDVVVRRAVRFAIEGTVETVDGAVLPVRPRSLCLHGDTPGAVHLAGLVRHALVGAGVLLRPFAA